MSAWFNYLITHRDTPIHSRTVIFDPKKHTKTPILEIRMPCTDAKSMEIANMREIMLNKVVKYEQKEDLKKKFFEKQKI